MTKNNKLWTVALINTLFGLSTLANASSNWNSTPSWAQQQGTNSAQQKKPTQQTKQVLYKTPTPAPFTPDSNNVAIDVGQVFLLGENGSKYTDALGMQLHYTYGVSDVFGFDSSFGYSSHADGKYSIAKLDAGLRTNLTWYDKVIPYAIVGLGFYRPSILLSDNITSVSPVVFGLHLGAGVTLQMTQQLFFGASLTFHDMFGTTAKDPLHTDPLTGNPKVIQIDGTYTAFFLNVGMSF